MHVANSQRPSKLLCACELEHFVRQIDARDASPAPREDSRVGPFAASGVEHALTVQVADKFEERRVVPIHAKDVEVLADLVGPYLGIAIPLRGNFGLENLRRHSLPPARIGAARLKKMRTRESRPLSNRISDKQSQRDRHPEGLASICAKLN